MQIIYGGIQIANEPPAGTDGVLGFELPKAQQDGEWIEALRAKDAFPRSYGNRRRVLTGTIRPASVTTLAAAKLAREQWYEMLPLNGVLVTQQDAEVTTYALAMLKDIGIAEETEGVSYGLVFTFWVGPPTFTTATTVLGDGTGNILGTGSGGGELSTGV